jgi:hypothetical protein
MQSIWGLKDFAKAWNDRAGARPLDFHPEIPRQ